MGRGGDADGDCVQVELARPACLQARCGGGKHGQVFLPAQFFGCGRIGIHNGRHLDSRRTVQLTIDAQVVTPESAGSEDGNA